MSHVVEASQTRKLSGGNGFGPNVGLRPHPHASGAAASALNLALCLGLLLRLGLLLEGLSVRLLRGNAKPHCCGRQEAGGANGVAKSGIARRTASETAAREHTPLRRAPGLFVFLARSPLSFFSFSLSLCTHRAVVVVPLGAPAPLPVHSCCHLGQWSVPEHTREVATAAGEIYTSPDRSAHSQACTCKEATKGLAFEWRQQYVYT